jgi:TPR repeat protein
LEFDADHARPALTRSAALPDSDNKEPELPAHAPITAWPALRRLFSSICALLLLAAPALAVPADAPFRLGLSAYNSGDYAKALKIWLPLAQAEDAPAQAGIGFMYRRGLGVAIDNQKAAYWLRKAAEHGQPEGQMMLGSLYFYGAGVEKDFIKAYAWCDLAQDGGNADAQSCRDAALQSLLSQDDVKAAFRLSLDFHHRFSHPH